MTSSTPTRICLFCGASPGASPAHMAAAKSLAKTLHEHSIQLIYGGGTTGLMGEVAKNLVKLSGKDSVIGIIPSSLLGKERPGEGQAGPKGAKGEAKKEKLPRNWAKRMGLVQGKGQDESNEDEQAKLLLEKEYGHCLLVPDIQARKTKMMELTREGGPGSGFVALTGGLGTLDELAEMLSLNYSFGVHRRGACVLNVNGFWDGLLEWVQKAVDEKLVRGDPKHVLGNVSKAADVVAWLKAYDEGKK
ncbi:MAG: hypothetical protein L6R41_001832 [Letrouitia leprolyta]|nr:MAG: hypothetical protein L6R41_001832 [Letrouitia leprolyta]